MSKTLYVGNIPFDANADELAHLFGKHGTVASVQIMTDPLGRFAGSLGFAFVEMNNGSEKAIAALNGSEFRHQSLIVNEAEPHSQDTDQMLLLLDRYRKFLFEPTNPEYRRFMQELHRLALTGHAGAAQHLAGVLATEGPFYAPAAAYKWYYVGFWIEGYSVELKEPATKPYVGDIGDFRNEAGPNALVDKLGLATIRQLDVEAAKWLARQNFK